MGAVVLLECSGYSLTSLLVPCGGKSIQAEPPRGSIHLLPVMLSFDQLSGEFIQCLCISIILI